MSCEHTARNHGANTVLDCKCEICKTWYIVTIPRAEYEAWAGGIHIADAIPSLAPPERELLCAGFCPTCWRRTFDDPEDAYAAAAWLGEQRDDGTVVYRTPAQQE